MHSERAARLCALNDELRQHGRGGEVYVTAGIDALGPQLVVSILTAMARYDSFNSDNDPYGEHDFGAFEIAGQQIFFKVEYYDLQGRHGSPDPCDPSKTIRVLMVMLAAEY